MSATPAEPRREWYEACPARVEWELGEFAARGLPAEKYSTDAGRLAIRTSLPFEGQPIEIAVVFPFDYPEVEPTAYGPPGLIPRHQHRRSGNFCLMENPAVDWWPTMSAAQLVDEDLRWLLDDSATGPGAVAAGEADMPEPLSEHIPGSSGRVALVPDPFWQFALDASEGELTIHDASFGGGEFVSEVEGIGACDQRLLEHFRKSKGSRHVGRWAAIPEGAIEPYPSREDILNAAIDASPDLLKRLRRSLDRERRRQSVDGWVGVTFIEEGPRRRDRRRGWVLLEVRLDRRGHSSVLHALTAQAVTSHERDRRVPELVGLADASMLVVGAGSIGAPIALELAKAGVGRTIVADHDRYDVNNAVRHVLDPRWAGTPKATAVALEAEDINPFVSVEHRDLRVGGGGDDGAGLHELVTDVDLVIDATGSHAAARIMQRRCIEAGKVFMVAALTAGSYGGEVAVFRPDGPCFWCFVLSQEEGLVPKPLEGPTSNVMPIGCSAPAFSGAGFDATALAALAVRTAVRASGKCSYEALDFDYVIVNFRGDHAVHHGTLAPHRQCPLGH